MPVTKPPTSSGSISHPHGKASGTQDFIDHLVKEKVISLQQAKDVLNEASRLNKPVKAAILSKEIMNEEDLLAEKASFLGLDWRLIPTEQKIPEAILSQIPEEAAKTYRMVPLARDGNILEVGMITPEDVRAQEALQFIAARNNFIPKRILISPIGYEVIVRQYRSLGGEVTAALGELEKELQKTEEIETRPAPQRTVGEILEEEAPIVKMVSVILRHASEGGASDIHIEPLGDRLRVRFRMDGILHTSILLPIAVHPAIVSRIKILANLKIDETRLPQDGRFHAVMEGKEFDFRVATLPTANGEKVTIRVLDPTTGVKSLGDLGVVGHNRQVIEGGIRKPYGMILISGPTGSGKSTTLYALLKILNKEVVNIVSLEDPIEYTIDGVNQSQIHEDIGYTFSSGLRHILRGDPNVIMVGEIRDSDTAKLAIHAALTGHLVLTTIHTNNAVGIIPRIIDMGVEPFLVPSSVAVGIAQRLVQKLCNNCKTIVSPERGNLAIIERELKNLPEEEKKRIPAGPIKVWNAPGCDKCAGHGTKGLIAIFESFDMTQEMEQIIVDDLTEGKILEEIKRQGMVTMLQDGILKALEGIVSIEEVLRVVEEHESNS